MKKAKATKPENMKTVERFSLSASVTLALELVREALKVIEKGEIYWGSMDIEAEPIQNGLDMEALRHYYGYDPTNDQLVRTVYIKGRYLNRGGFVNVTSECHLHDYRSFWEPQCLTIYIGEDAHLFIVKEKTEEGRYILKDLGDPSAIINEWEGLRAGELVLDELGHRATVVSFGRGYVADGYVPVQYLDRPSTPSTFCISADKLTRLLIDEASSEGA